MAVYIEPLDASNMGGNCGPIYMLPVVDGLQMAYPLQQRITKQLRDAGDLPVTWDELNATRDTIDFIEQEREYNGTTIYSITIPFEIAQDTYTKLATLYDLTKQRFIIRLKDRNGHVRIVGRPESPMRMRILSRTTRERTPLRNGYTGQFILSPPDPAPFYDPDDMVIDGIYSDEYTDEYQ